MRLFNSKFIQLNALGHPTQDSHWLQLTLRTNTIRVWNEPSALMRIAILNKNLLLLYKIGYIFVHSPLISFEFDKIMHIICLSLG